MAQEEDNDAVNGNMDSESFLKRNFNNTLVTNTWANEYLLEKVQASLCTTEWIEMTVNKARSPGLTVREAITTCMRFHKENCTKKMTSQPSNRGQKQSNI